MHVITGAIAGDSGGGRFLRLGLVVTLTVTLWSVIQRPADFSLSSSLLEENYSNLHPNSTNLKFLMNGEVRHHHPDNKIVINLGMPRTGTTSWISMLKELFQSNGEFHHIYKKYQAEDLFDLLLHGKRCSPSNPLLRLLSLPATTTGAVRVMADHPFFLLASIARDFPHVYWIQMTRDVQSHSESMRYMLQRYCQDRCRCRSAPYCTRGRMAVIDQLFYNRFGQLGQMCKDGGDARHIPEELLVTWLRLHEEETGLYMEGHPRFLRLRMEDGPEVNMVEMARFLGLNKSGTFKLDSKNNFHENKREW